jgi:hypothetical protein
MLKEGLLHNKRNPRRLRDGTDFCGLRSNIQLSDPCSDKTTG